MTRRVCRAQPYRPGNMGSFGEASMMLIGQFNFPDEFDENESFLSADHDRCFMWDYNHANRCFKEHTGTGDLGFEQWVWRSSDEKIMNFIKDILKADPKINWTGYRVLGTVNRSSGYPVWSLQLFAKNPDSKTKVYSGHIASNVEVDPFEPVFIPIKNRSSCEEPKKEGGKCTKRS